MGKITQPVKTWSLITGVSFFTFLFLSASTAVFSESGIAGGFFSFVSDSEENLAIAPSIDVGTNPEVCQGTTTAFLSYTNPVNDPQTYSIEYDLNAASQGFTDILGEPLQPEEILLNVPAGAEPGTYTGYLVVENSTESSVQYTFEITISSSLIAPPPVSAQNDPGFCYASSVDTGSPENCTGGEVTAYVEGVLIDPSTYEFPTGTTIISWQVTDDQNTVHNVTQEVQVHDTKAPVITAPADLDIATDADGTTDCTTTAALGNPVITDCSDVSVKAYINGLEVDPLTYNFTPGSTIVLWEATDTSGNTATAEQTVTVTDQEAPKVTAQDITIALGTNGTVSITPADIDNGSMDNCGIQNYSLDKTSFDCISLGPNTVRLTVTDTAGNTGFADATVTVEDNRAPVAKTRNISLVLNANGTQTIAENRIDNGSTGPCGMTFDTSITDFDCTSLGGAGKAEIPVTLTVASADGSALDIEPATITLYENIEYTGEQNIELTAVDDGTCKASATTDPSVDATGGCTRQTYAVTGTRSDNLALNDPYPVGTTTITWKADGHPSSWLQTVTVTEVSNPVFDPATPAEDTVFTATDKCFATPADLPEPVVTDCRLESLTNDAPAQMLAGQTYPVTWKATDSSGNETTFSQTIKIEDTISPTLLVQPYSIALDTSGEAVFTQQDLEAVTAGSSDNCAIESIVVDPASTTSFNCGTVGTHTIQLIATDVHGNETFQSFELTVEDTSAPSILVNDITVQLDASGTIGITADQIDNGSTDNCGVAGLSIDKTSFDCTNLGVNEVILTVTDVNGVQNTATATVTVEDTIVPTAVTNNITVPLDANGTAVITANDIDGGSSDNCTIKDYAVDIANFDCTNIGDNQVTLTVTDSSGNSSSAPATVTIEDTINPVAVAQNITVFLDGTGTASIIPADIDNGSSDNCTAINLSLDIDSFDCSNIGENDVILTATDSSGNSNSVPAVVTVKDDEIPVIEAVTDIVQNNDPGECSAIVSVTTPVASDNCTIGQPVGTRSDGASLTDAYPVGKTYITWSVTDANGNEAVVVDQMIHIRDGEVPESPVLEDVYTSCIYTFTPPVTNDHCSGSVTATTKDELTYYPQNSPTTEIITWIFEDGSGNITEVEQTLHIIPLIADFTATNVSCNGGSDGSIEIIASGGKEPYMYAVGNDAFGNDPVITGLPAGLHNAKVQDAYGCIFEQEIEILEPEVLNLETPTGVEVVTTTAESCFGANDGEIRINGTMSGGNGSYLYSVDNENFFTSPTITGLASGEYEVYIRDTNNCNLSRYIPATVEGPDELLATVTQVDEVTCFDSNTGSIRVSNPSGGNGTTYQFRINNGDWKTNATSDGFLFEGLAAGEHKIEILDATGGCIKVLEEAFLLTQPDPLVVDVSTTRTTTYGSATGTATATPSGGNGQYTYLWKDPAGNEIGVTSSITTRVAGTYSLTVTDGKYCSTTVDVNIYDIIKAEIEDLAYCETEEDTIRTSTFQIDLNKTVGGQGDPAKYKYEWDFGIEAPMQTATGIGPFTIKYPTTGDKTINLKVTDEGGVSREFTYTHYVGICEASCDSSANFAGHVDSFYIGDADGNKIFNNCDDNEPMYLYFKVEKNANAYRLFTRYSYTIKSGPNEPTKEYTIENCFAYPDERKIEAGDIIQLNRIGDAPDEIHWKCDDIMDILHITYKWTNQTGQTCDDTRRNMCASSNELISVATPIRATVQEISNACHGDANGYIILDVFGGTGDFTFFARNNTTGITYESTVNSINNLPAGNYTVTVVDNKQVTDDDQPITFVIENIDITEPANPLDAQAEVLKHVSCYGLADGSARVYNITGGTPPYSYSWNVAQPEPDMVASDLKAGTYTVTVTDANDCTITRSVTIEQPTKVTQAMAGANLTRCGFISVTLQANTPAADETGTWTLVSGPEGSTIFNVNDPASEFTGSKGVYVLRWTITHDLDQDSCPTTSDVTIEIIEDCNYLDFDGLDDYIHFGDNYGFDSGPFSMEAWVKLKSTSGTKTILSKKASNDPDTKGYELVVSAGAPAVRWGGKSISPNTSSLLNTQRWYHIAATFDGTNVRLYVDGILVNTAAHTNPGVTSAPFLIGASAGSGNVQTKSSSHFKGWIEEVRLWNTALSAAQIRFMMNQRVEDNGGVVKGVELPLDVPGPLSWAKLEGYYPLLSMEAAVGDGTTLNKGVGNVHGVLKNITTFQDNTAPLPYVSRQDGIWRDIRPIESPWLHHQGTWDAPNSMGINGNWINWNIVRTTHKITSGNKDIKVLGLLSDASPEGEGESKLTMANPNYEYDELNPGHGLWVTHYLKLDGVIDLVGESQLIQTEGSILEPASAGYLERDQQGTASSFNYNYWSSPVSTMVNGVNSGYELAAVMLGGTDSKNPHIINFNYRYAHADGPATTPIKISTYWLNKFYGEAGKYSEWKWVGQNGHLEPGQGVTMKGSQDVSVFSGKQQNYVFRGLPHNGDIELAITPNTNYLIGNPYPSALDANEFIKDNLSGRRDNNVFNGSLYFWSHFSGKTHYLSEYIGGYATYNLSGGVRAIANDARINATGSTGGLMPKRFIPVGQAFFVSTVVDPGITNWNTDQATIVEGDIRFKNSQRAFQREEVERSVFHGQEATSKEEKSQEEEKVITDKRKKIWLRFDSPMGYSRQILVTADPETTFNFDMGYDAPLNDRVAEDMYWMMHDKEFVIQGVPAFSKDQELPFGIKTAQNGNFKVSIDTLENIPGNFAILLKDSLNGETHDLRESSFKLSVTPEVINNRFSIVFLNEKEEFLEEEENLALANVDLYYSNKNSEINIHNPDLVQVEKAYLYNLNGQLLEVFTDIATENLVKVPITIKTSGVYIFKLETTAGSKSTKFVIGSE